MSTPPHIAPAREGLQLTTIVGCARTRMLGADTYASTSYRATKLFRTKTRGIFGCAGDDTFIARFEDWLLRGKRKPKMETGEGFEAIQLHKGVLYVWGEAMRPEVLLHPFPVDGKAIPALFGAVGSGAPYALGCLAQGGTIHEAMRIAELYDSGSRSPFQTLKEIP